MKVLIVAALASCHHEALVASRPSAPDARPVLAAMAATYEAASSYSDHGSVTSAYREGDAEVQNRTKTFETTFVRSQRFRFDLRDENEPQHGFLVWSDGRHTYDRWFGPPRTVDEGTNLGAGIVAASAEASVAGILPRLLLPDSIPGTALTALANPKLTGSEPIGDRPCWIVTGAVQGDAVSLWIDQESHLLRRMSRQRTAGNGRVEELTSFEPLLDPAIDLAQIPPFDPDEQNLGIREPTDPFDAVRALANTTAPPFDALLVSGSGPSKLADLGGHVVLVDFWATWCHPCQMVMPHLDALQKQYADRGLRVIGLSGEDPDVIRRFAQKTNLGYTLAHDADDQITQRYKVPAFPLLFVVDQTGTIRNVIIGADFAAVDNAVAALLP